MGWTVQRGTFDIMNFLSHTGKFSSVTGTDLGGGFMFNAQYNPTDVVVSITGPSNASPETAHNR